MIAGAESRNSRRWCSPTPKLSRPAWSGWTICSTSCCRRSCGLTARLVSSKAAAKLSIPICMEWLTLLNSGSACGRGRRSRHREIHSCPLGKPGRSHAGNSVCERNPVGGIRAQVRVGLKVPEHLRHLLGPGEQIRELFPGYFPDREIVALPVERADDFAEAQEISDERQVLAVARLIRVRECPGNDVAELADVPHVHAAHIGIERKSPTQGSVGLHLRGQGWAHEVLVVHRRDKERVVRKAGFLNDPVNPGLP